MGRHVYRRLALISFAVVAVFIDGALIAKRMTSPTAYAWTAYMPDVEKAQIEGRNDMLYGSEGWDERIPASSVLVSNLGSQPSMFRDFVKCRADAVVYELPIPFPEMPIRYYLYARDERVGACARRVLPKGYRLVEGRLPRPTVRDPFATQP